MKMIHAYVRSTMVGQVIESLLEQGCPAVSVVEVRGIMPGLRREEYAFSVHLAQPVESVAKLEIVAADDRAAEWAEVIARTASTGALGDGMVFLLPVDGAIRISTGAQGEAALPVPPGAKGEGRVTPDA